MYSITINMRLNLSWKDVCVLGIDNENKLISKRGKADILICAVSETVILLRESHHSVHSIQTIKKSVFLLDSQYEISNESNLDWKAIASTFTVNFQRIVILLNGIYGVQTVAGKIPIVTHLIDLRYCVILIFMQFRWL